MLWEESPDYMKREQGKIHNCANRENCDADAKYLMRKTTKQRLKYLQHANIVYTQTTINCYNYD